MSNIVLGLLCGLPASGKSTLARKIRDHVGRSGNSHLCAIVLHYDSLIPAELEQQLIAQTDEQGGSLWKSARVQITACVDCLLNALHQGQKALSRLVHTSDNGDHFHTSFPNLPETDSSSEYFVKPPEVELSLWERFVRVVGSCVKERMLFGGGSEGDVCSYLVLVDDNMHYSSMRYQYCQLARKHEVGLCVIHLSCPVEEALRRNGCRTEDRVDDSVIRAMQQHLETPDPDKRPWEKYSATIDGTSGVEVQPLLEMIEAAMMDPQQPSLEENLEEKVVSRYVCSTNAVHQADQILRRCVSQCMVEAKGAGLRQDELRNQSSQLTKIRSAILSDLRQGEVTVPFQLDERDVSNASKSPDSPFFQFVQALFSARVK